MTPTPVPPVPARARRRTFGRWLAGAAVAALLASACGTTDETEFASAPPEAGGGDGGAAAPAPDPDPACRDDDPVRSLAPSAQVQDETGAPLPPDQLPADSYMRQIIDRDTLVAGVGADTLLFGYLSPRTGDIEGFDVEMARLVADALGVNLELRPIQSSERIPLLTTEDAGDRLDLVVKTMTVNCARWGAINFSSVYYESGQTLLVGAESGIESIDEVTDEVICAVSGTTSLENLTERGVAVSEVGDWTDCLVEFQQGRVDGVSTDDTILAGLADQDPNARIVSDDPFTEEPYGIGLPKEHPEFTEYVNAVLQQARVDSTWTATYDAWLAGTLGPVPAPPAATYR